MKPIARVLLAAGIGHREFAEVSKTAFVDVATRDFGLRGRPTNISRVAVMTGLTRKEVRRIRDTMESGVNYQEVRSTPLAEILHRWYTDPEFVNASGAPVELVFDGDEPNFSSLVRKYGGDIPPGAMRTELKRIGSIQELPNGSLRLIRRNVSGLNDDEQVEAGFAKVMYPAGLGLLHNIQSDSQDERWVHRTAATRYIRKEDVPRVKRICTERLKEFSLSMDDLFAAYEGLYESDDASGSARAVGIGVFYFEEDKSESDIFG